MRKPVRMPERARGLALSTMPVSALASRCVCMHSQPLNFLLSLAPCIRCRLSLSVGRKEGWSAFRLCLQKQIGKNAR